MCMTLFVIKQTITFFKDAQVNFEILYNSLLEDVWMDYHIILNSLNFHEQSGVK